MKPEPPERTVLGSEEWCALPGLGLPAIKARVDSGARTSALHAFDTRAFRRDGAEWVSFGVHPVQNDRRVLVRCEAPVVDYRAVKGTGGDAQKRFVIGARLEIGEHSWDIELTLANRDSMGYRMLLGREALVGRALVDPAASFCLGEKSEDELQAAYGEFTRNGGGLRIAVLGTDPELYGNRALLEAGVARGHDMTFLDIRECYTRLHQSAPEVHYRGSPVAADIDAFIPRVRRELTDYGTALLRQFENLGPYGVNSAQAIARSRDPLNALQQLLRSGLPLPRTALANAPRNLDDLLDLAGGPPLVVSGGQDVPAGGGHIGQDTAGVRALVEERAESGGNLRLQEWIASAQGRALELFVVEGRVAAAVEHLPSETANAPVYGGGAARRARLRSGERRLALRAARAFGLRLAAVTLLRSERGPLVLAVNPNPGFRVAARATGINLADTLVAALEKRLQWRDDR